MINATTTLTRGQCEQPSKSPSTAPFLKFPSKATSKHSKKTSNPPRNTHTRCYRYHSGLLQPTLKKPIYPTIWYKNLKHNKCSSISTKLLEKYSLISQANLCVRQKVGTSTSLSSTIMTPTTSMHGPSRIVSRCNLPKPTKTSLNISQHKDSNQNLLC